jgi:hypothetical protein
VSGLGSGWWQRSWQASGLLPDAESFGQGQDGLEVTGAPEDVASELLLRREES